MQAAIEYLTASRRKRPNEKTLEIKTILIDELLLGIAKLKNDFAAVSGVVSKRDADIKILEQIVHSLRMKHDPDYAKAYQEKMDWIVNEVEKAKRK